MSSTDQNLEERGVNLKVLDQAIDTSTPTGKPLFNVLASIAELETAIRAERQANLRKDDVDFNKSSAILRDTKNGDSRTIPLSKVAIAALEELIRESTTDRVLKLTSSCISYRFTRACKQAEKEGMVLHSLRHEAVSRLFEKRLNMMEVASISGHKDLSMLKRYTHINPETLLARL